MKVAAAIALDAPRQIAAQEGQSSSQEPAVRVRLRRVAVIVYSIANASFVRLSQPRLTSVDSFHAHIPRRPRGDRVCCMFCSRSARKPCALASNTLHACFCLAVANSNARVNSARQGSSALILTSAQWYLASSLAALAIDRVCSPFASDLR